MRRFDAAERRARLGVRHHLAATALADDVSTVAHDLVAVHSTDAASVHLGLLARTTAGTTGTVERALYEDRTLIRLLGMRRTVFVTSAATAPVVQAACGDEIAERERRKLLALLRDGSVEPVGPDLTDDPETWLGELEEAALAALVARGTASASQLADDVPALRADIVLSRGKNYEGRQGVASRVVFLLAAQGRAVRTRPRGSWTSSQYGWSAWSSWCPQGRAWSGEDAEVELARRWLAAYGPATVADLQWWTGWTKTRTRRALGTLGPVEVDLGDAGPGIALADDLGPTDPPAPWAALLPALDTTPMGWQQRGWFLDDHAPRLFDGNGNVGPTVWWDGRVVGGWAQDAAGDVVHQFVEDVGSDARDAVVAAAAATSARLDGARPGARARGRTAVEQGLS